MPPSSRGSSSRPLTCLGPPSGRRTRCWSQPGRLSLVRAGIRRRGVPLAEPLGDQMARIEGVTPPVGALDASFYPPQSHVHVGLVHVGLPQSHVHVGPPKTKA